jgi:hypothetical protein
MAVAALSLAIFLGIVFWDLFRRTRNDLSRIELRIQAVENLSEPFSSKLAESVPQPLRRVIHLYIEFDSTFWRETLKPYCSPEELERELEKAKMSDFLNRKFPEEGADYFFSPCISARIEEWRGGYTHMAVRRPGHLESSELYPGNEWDPSVWDFGGPKDAMLWYLRFPPRAGEITAPHLMLYFKGSSISLSVTGTCSSSDDTLRSRGEFLLEVPLAEGREAAAFYTLDPWRYKRGVRPWLRCYQNLDRQKGLAWQVWVHDCELFSRSGGNRYQADSCLLDDYRKIIADYRTGEENRAFYQHLADSIEAGRAAERLSKS